MQSTATKESIIHKQQVLITLEGYLLGTHHVPGTMLGTF